MATVSYDIHTYTPIVFSGENAEADFSAYRKTWESHYGQMSIIDDTTPQADEYELLLNPSLLRGSENKHHPLTNHAFAWIVIPWKKAAVRTLAQEAFALLRTSRNHHLITKDELAVLSQKRIGIAGLNVGNPAAICLAQEGIGTYFRMADNDTLSLSNLNRFRASITDLGINKAVLSARQAHEINPFLSIDVWEDGVSMGRLSEFVSGLDILIEEMDALPLKIAIREEARKQGVPTIMVTGNGHDIILDIERFDTSPDLPLLSGMLTRDVRARIDVGAQTFDEKIALAQDFMGKQYLCERLNASFGDMGTTLIGIPQLAEASFLRGAVLAHATRGILLGESGITSGRYVFGLSDLYTQKK